MYAVGIDVSKDISTVSIITIDGEVIEKPFSITHCKDGINLLLNKLKNFEKSHIKFLMESTGHYHIPLLNHLYELGYFVSVINALTIKKYCDLDLRKVKTDNKDSFKIAQYCSEHWYKLKQYIPTEETRSKLQFLSRQYFEFISVQTRLKIQLTNLTDSTFPTIKNIIDADNRYQLFLDIYERYPHPQFVINKSKEDFINDIDNIAKKNGHRIGKKVGELLYQTSFNIIPSSPFSDSIQLAITNCISLLKETLKVTDNIITEMDRLSSSLPEFVVVSNMKGVGVKTRSRIIAEVGDINRFRKASKLVAYCGIDTPPYESGQFKAINRRISKRGNKYLRRVGYEIMSNIKRSRPKTDNAVYEFIVKKEEEGKMKKTAKIAGLNKFLRIYYARVKEIYNN